MKIRNLFKNQWKEKFYKLQSEANEKDLLQEYTILELKDDVDLLMELVIKIKESTTNKKILSMIAEFEEFNPLS